ncbi:MAG: hypothetical protein AAFU86_01630 [Pseudomonadota bacterium]
MRYLLALVMLVLAFPAMAQQSSICRNKQVFDIGGGASACLIEVGQTSIRETLTRDDGQGSKRNSSMAALIHVVAFGAFDPRLSLTSRRMSSICNAFRDRALSGVPQSARSIVIRIDWPEAPDGSARNRSVVSKSGQPVQAAFANRSCRSVRYFG